jgi:hypothetical protein
MYSTFYSFMGISSNILVVTKRTLYLVPLSFFSSTWTKWVKRVAVEGVDGHSVVALWGCP